MTDTKPTPMKPGEPLTLEELRCLLKNATEIRDQTASSGMEIHSVEIDEARELARKGFPVGAEEFAAMDQTCSKLCTVFALMVPHLEATLKVMEKQNRHLEFAKATLLEVEWRGSEVEYGYDGQPREYWCCPICGQRESRGEHSVDCSLGDTLVELCPPRALPGPELGVDTEARDG